MKTDQHRELTTIFLQTISVAVAQLKHRLQQDYEQVYPGLHEVIHLVLDEEEANAWNLSSFPHLLLPGLVEAPFGRPRSETPETRPGRLLMARPFPGIPTHQPAL